MLFWGRSRKGAENTLGGGNTHAAELPRNTWVSRARWCRVATISNKIQQNGSYIDTEIEALSKYAGSIVASLASIVGRNQTVIAFTYIVDRCVQELLAEACFCWPKSHFKNKGISSDDVSYVSNSLQMELRHQAVVTPVTALNRALQ